MKRFVIRLAALCLVLCLLAGCGAPAAQEQNTDGVFQLPVTLEGGSGKAKVDSPAEVRAEDGAYTAVIRWSSANYDYMIVDGETYYPLPGEEVSVFEIPIPAPPCAVPVQADTTAMSQPHLIDYTLTFGEDEPAAETAETAAAPASAPEPLPGLVKTGSMALDYAKEFTVDHYEGGCSLITIPGDGSRFLLVPEGAVAPEGLPSDVRVLRAPVENIYLVASAAADLFAACEGLSSVRFIGQKGEDCAVPGIREAVEAGDILYAGKYSAPDYERICAEGCGLAVENTMIYHTPEVREQLEAFGVPVLVEHSSYEATPQGRMEWIKLYGLITGHEAEAEAAYEAQMEKFAALEGLEPTGKSVAYFYISSTGMAVVRRSGDYIPALIALAGGEYAFPDLGAKEGSHTATASIQLEEFYAAVRDVDYLIYSSDIGGALESVDDLLAKCALLENCRAVREGHVFCTTGNLYQSAMEMGDFVTDLRRMLTEEDPEMTFLYKVE